MSNQMRPTPRSVSIAFAAAVAANFAALGLGRGQPPPAWVPYAPLLPCAVLLTGLCLFALPSAARRRSAPRGQTGGAQAGALGGARPSPHGRPVR
ncbi:hypothetical protein tb265_49410 [Gemmatimonadetes bacterium T265]|nr:hypothetical protein tb265_47520 [Gemmatimonadetes bacterium T265]GJG89760.1 hypothetical protein tb265_49410 [Gemmatimonadetes bacterium T265]